MAATEPETLQDPQAPAPPDALGAVELLARLSEEVARAERLGNSLSCLAVIVDDLGELDQGPGESLRQELTAYLARAVSSELRTFDRVGVSPDGTLMVILPGADGPTAELVARRILERIRTIKLESGGARRPIRVSVGLAAWRESVGAEQLAARAVRVALAPVAAGELVANRA